MGGFLFLFISFCNSNHRSLRRTLVRLARYSTSSCYSIVTLSLSKGYSAILFHAKAPSPDSYRDREDAKESLRLLNLSFASLCEIIKAPQM